ncbi:BAG domain-containing protein Samui-like [Bacillus rossius redtenbacheri]|uniref:BAG domain-containing protein Samui-like n=1 Tax=Bacillus rossius redtenbacheri TaxID=93214 RepID=UPI002FDE4B89
MSFSFRDRPSLSERLRGRTGDQLLQDLEKEIEEDRKMFFDKGPSWNTTPRSGSFSRAFPFEDSPRRQDIRSHLEDLAQRHPEFAEHLRCPPWGGEVGAHGSRRDRRQSGGDDAHSQASSSGSEAAPGPESRGGLAHHGLRNTVDIGQQQHSSEQPKESRGQRSMSAPPPDSRGPEQAPRYVTRLNITPSTNTEGAPADQGKPPVAPKQQPPPQQPSSPKQPSGGNVRHIPIFVEGRDEPVLPKNVGPSSYVPKPSPPPPPHSFGRPMFNTHHHYEPQTPPQTPPQARKFQPQQQAPPPPPPPQQQQQAPPKPQPPPANDPISRVMAVQRDIDELAVKVGEFWGNSRKDKQYIYLDEMLTRNLLKLDDIETEGKENVRLARKEAIRSIQECINILEGKAPLPEEAGSAEPMEAGESEAAAGDKEPEQMMEVESNETGAEQATPAPGDTPEKTELASVKAPEGSEEPKPMEVEPTKEAVAEEEKAMEVEEKTTDAAMPETGNEPAGDAEATGGSSQTNVQEQSVTAGPEKTTGAAESVAEAGGESTDPGAVKETAELGASKESGAAEASMEATAEPAQAAPSPQDGASKGSESPRQKGRGAKAKKEGVMTKKGRAGKSAERKGSVDAKKEPSDAACGPESGDASKTAG